MAREGQSILVGFLAGKTEPTQLVLHRMRSAEALAAPARLPPEFSFRAYAQSAAMGMGNGEWVQLHLVLNEDKGWLFTESKLSPDQQVEVRMLKSGEKRYHVKATLEDSPRLRAYLDSLGDSLIKRTFRSATPPASQDAATSTRSTHTRAPA